MIKASELLQTVKRIGRENPHHVVRKCRYFNEDGTPCCIVGAALAEHGVDPEPFLLDDELNSWTPVSLLLDSRRLVILNDLDVDQRRALSQVQGKQDGKTPWVIAVQGLGD